MSLVLLIIGFVCLIKGADWFVDGSCALARRLHVPSVVIGLTIVALGTSLPELSVSVTAALADQNELAISNVIGSNIFNTLVVAGTSAVIAPFVVPKSVIQRDVPFNLFITIVLAVLSFMFGMLTRWDGAILLALLGAYLYILFKQSKQETEHDETEEQMPLGKMLLLLAGGLTLIVLGGTWTVDGAEDLAAALGLSSTFIGLTIVALGTSLPELVTSVVAAKKGESALSIGNVLGSNILNILFILGISALLHPIPVQLENILDCLILGGVSLMLYLMFCNSDKMSRKRGIAFLLLYVLYVIFITVR